MGYNRNRLSPSRRQTKCDFVITDKAIMGGYYNLARLNFFKTMMTIFTKVGINVTGIKEEFLHNYLCAIFHKLDSTVDMLNDPYKKWAEELELNNDQLYSMQQLLFNHLPFLGPIMGGEASNNINRLKGGNLNNRIQNDVMRGMKLDDCLKVVLRLARCLNSCRDYYTHYNPYDTVEDQKEKYKTQKRVASMLSPVMDAARRIVKQHNNLKSQDMDFLTGIDRFRSQIKKDEFGNAVLDNRGKVKKEFVEYEDYYFRIRGKRHPIDAVGYKIEGEEPCMALSDFGVVFLCTLFLDKGHAGRMLDELELFEKGPYDGSQDGDSAKNGIIREIMTFYRIKVPRGKRLDPMDDRTLLAMDMLNELRKCPMELYNVLSREGQQTFEDAVRRPNDKTPEVFKRLRSTDRFPYLALRYIDLNKCFNDIRFQVQLGIFRYKFYDKTTIDGEQVVRGLKKDINGYGRLQDVERSRQEKYGEMLQEIEMVETGEEDITIANFVPDTATSAPYLTDRAASYNIHSNRIGMYWNCEGEKAMLTGEKQLYLPDLSVDENGKAPVEMPAPRASLSARDLPALVFYLYLRHDDEKLPSPERIIMSKHDALVRFFKDVAQGTLRPVKSMDALKELLRRDYDHLLTSEIPDKLRNYLASVKGDEDDESCAERLKKHALEVLSRRYSQVEARLNCLKEARKMVGSKDNRYGKKSYVDVRPRLLAEQLAKSIVDWQPSVNNGRNKMTGKNYQRMIAFLASYVDDVPIQHLKGLFMRAHLLDGSTPHPFLSQVLDTNPNNIEVLYDRYFKEEKKLILACLNIKKNKNGDEYCLYEDADLSAFPFLHPERIRFQKRNDVSYRNLATRYLQVDGRPATIMLPDGLFTQFILKALKGKPYSDNENLQRYLKDKDLNCNAAYLMSVYLEHVMHDCSQPFYRSDSSDDRFARRYDLFAILQDKKKGNELMPCPITPTEINRRLTARAANGKKKQIEFETHTLLEPIKRKAEARILEINKNKELTKEARDKMAKKVRDNCLEECEKLKKRITRKITDVKKNERTIRRYKTQDMALFLMAKHILGEALMKQDENNKGSLLLQSLYLRNVCNPDFLSQTITAKYPLKVKVDKKREEDFYVIQENMSIKNYGVFYQFLNDERIDSLLAKLIEQRVVRYNELSAELANYDHNRSKMFRDLQQFEQMAFDKSRDILTNPDNPDFYKEKDKKKRVVRRNNFKHLLELLAELDSTDGLDDDVINWLNGVRTAFCHNTYRMDMEQIEKTLPKIIEQIVQQVERLLGQTKNKLP